MRLKGVPVWAFWCFFILGWASFLACASQVNDGDDRFLNPGVSYYVVPGDGVWDIWRQDMTQKPGREHWMHLQHTTVDRVDLVLRLLNSQAVAE